MWRRPSSSSSRSMARCSIAAGPGKFYIDWAFALFGKKPSPAAPGRAVVASGLPARHGLGLGCCDHRDARLARLADAQALGLQSGRRPGLDRGGRHRRYPIAADTRALPPSSSPNISTSTISTSWSWRRSRRVLYYLSCWLMVEADARRLNVKPVKTSDQSLLGAHDLAGLSFHLARGDRRAALLRHERLSGGVLVDRHRLRL